MAKMLKFCGTIQKGDNPAQWVIIRDNRIYTHHCDLRRDWSRQEGPDVIYGSPTSLKELVIKNAELGNAVSESKNTDRLGLYIFESKLTPSF